MRRCSRVCVSPLRPVAGSVVVIVTVALGLLVWKGCQGLPPNVANCPITPTPRQILLYYRLRLSLRPRRFVVSRLVFQYPGMAQP